jgi:hypothetical protein
LDPPAASLVATWLGRAGLIYADRWLIADQTHSARIHGAALAAAERLIDNPALDPG